MILLDPTGIGGLLQVATQALAEAKIPNLNRAYHLKIELSHLEDLGRKLSSQWIRIEQNQWDPYVPYDPAGINRDREWYKFLYSLQLEAFQFHLKDFFELLSTYGKEDVLDSSGSGSEVV